MILRLGCGSGLLRLLQLLLEINDGLLLLADVEGGEGLLFLQLPLCGLLGLFRLS